MKRNIYILFTIGLFIRILPSHSVNLNTERLSNLKRLIENNIAYDSIAPIDSVIAWGQQLSPILEASGNWWFTSTPCAETSGKQSTKRDKCTKKQKR